jgi:hypothetical protein
MRSRMGTSTGSSFAKALRGWLQVIGLVTFVALVAYAAVWSIDPPWHVNELQGSIAGWGKQETPNVVIRYYKMLLFVRTDDGRNIGVSSERRAPPQLGERIMIQERVGLLGTRSFVEIPSR